jgi:DNA-binding response OmpR family regulator
MKILLADDDRDLVDIIGYVFERDGHGVVSAYNGESALRLFDVESPDLVVLELNLPKTSGLQVLRAIRARSEVPVLILSVVTDEDTIVDALDSGADDYLEKPFRPRELRARARALYRRNRINTRTSEHSPMPLQLGEIELDVKAHTVTVSGQPVRLTPTEFSLLSYLMRNHDVVVSAASIVQSVWGYNTEANEDVIRVNISRLRRKIEPDPPHPIYIITVPGVGYTFHAKSNGILRVHESEL